eukprot:TRINITY_DN23475_c0_g1_i1.p2 TRINITY_DN23475_c0_g1~~TRINITY_DN23475_c0_g1_i1.p2  ORF type:complete len:100 (+),score=12.95 TRINITY_DN23475_c0_g1_i1:186-485(+)
MSIPDRHRLPHEKFVLITDPWDARLYKGGLWAKRLYVPLGSGKGSNVRILVKEIVISLALGLAVGGVWKLYHWDYKRKVNQFYAELEKVQQYDEDFIND